MARLPRYRLGRLVALVASLGGAVACGGRSTQQDDHAGGAAGTTTQGAGGSDQAGTGGTSGAGDSGSVGGSGLGAGYGGSGGGASGGGSAGSAGSAEASCDDVTPCGGDVIGTWTVAGSCLTVSGTVDLTPLGAGCKEAAITGSLQVTGTLTAHGEGSVVSDRTTTTGNEQLDFPSDCLSVSGTKISCDQMALAIQPLGYAEVTCVDSAGTCTCLAAVEQTGQMALVAASAMKNGAYATADEVLTTLYESTATEYSYCVAGSTLTVSLKSPRSTGTVTGTIVLQKQ